MTPRPPSSPPFPYTTLFRSPTTPRTPGVPDDDHFDSPACRAQRRRIGPGRRCAGPHRSEEHTSELQSRGHLVCRLLLEKKKNKKTNNHVNSSLTCERSSHKC